MSEREKQTGGRPVEKVRQFELDELPRDEKGKVILPDNMTYPEFLKLIHPEYTERDIARIVKREERNAWVVRFQVLAFLLIVVVIVLMVVFS